MKTIIGRFIALAAAAVSFNLMAEDIWYLGAGGGMLSRSDCIAVTRDTSVFENGKWYYVPQSADISMTRIVVNGAANLILGDGCRLQVSGTPGKAGIAVETGNSLAIYGQFGCTGSLVASGCKGILDRENFETVPLKMAYDEATYFKMGAVVNESGFSGNYQNLAMTHFNSFTPKIIFTMDQSASRSRGENVNPQIRLNSSARTVLDLCSQNGIALRGGLLLMAAQWYGGSTTPSWFFRESFSDDGAYVSTDVMDQRLENYIKNVFELLANNYPGLELQAYDIVGEYFSDNGTIPDDTKSDWTRIFGQSYNVQMISKAFTYARKYAPRGCKLYYSDSGMEFYPKKRDAIYNEVKSLYDRGLCDGVSMQSAFNGGPYLTGYEEALEKFASIGCDIQITELCVGKNGLTDEVQAENYRQLFELYRKHRNHISSVTLAGIFDGESTDSNLFGFDQPFLFDSRYHPKSTYYAVVDEMLSGKSSAGIGGGSQSAGGTVTVNGGSVTAVSGGDAAGIVGTLVVAEKVIVKAGDSEDSAVEKPRGEGGVVTLSGERCCIARKTPPVAKAAWDFMSQTLRFVYDDVDAYGDRGVDWWDVGEAVKQNPEDNPDIPWSDAKNLVTNIVFDASFAWFRPNHCAYWFCNFSKLESIDGLENLDVSAATDLRYMFYFCRKLKTLDLSYFDTAKVRNIENMFSNCEALETIYVSDTFTLSALDESPDLFKVFGSNHLLVGSNGTKYSEKNYDYGNYARIDGRDGKPGYFTEKPITYTIRFAGNGGAGAMADMTCRPGKVYRLPKNAFSCGNSNAFLGWRGDNGRCYDDEMMVFDLTEVGRTITLTAIWMTDRFAGVQL